MSYFVIKQSQQCIIMLSKKEHFNCKSESELHFFIIFLGISALILIMPEKT